MDEDEDEDVDVDVDANTDYLISMCVNAPLETSLISCIGRRSMYLPSKQSKKLSIPSFSSFI